MSTELIDNQRISEIVERTDRASRGPWKASLEGRDHSSGSSCITTPGGGIDLDGAPDNDIEFIAHARQDIPYLIAEIRRLVDMLHSKDEAA
jgi:hypothetical protein